MTGIGLIFLRISAGTACTLSVGNKILLTIIMNKYEKYENQYEKFNKQLKLLVNYIVDKTLRHVIDENEFKSLLKIVLSIWNKRKINLFYRNEHENKSKF